MRNTKRKFWQHMTVAKVDKDIIHDPLFIKLYIKDIFNIP